MECTAPDLDVTVTGRWRDAWSGTCPAICPGWENGIPLTDGAANTEKSLLLGFQKRVISGGWNGRTRSTLFLKRALFYLLFRTVTPQGHSMALPTTKIVSNTWTRSTTAKKRSAPSHVRSQETPRHIPQSTSLIEMYSEVGTWGPSAFNECNSICYQTGNIRSG